MNILEGSSLMIFIVSYSIFSDLLSTSDFCIFLFRMFVVVFWDQLAAEV